MGNPLNSISVKGFKSIRSVEDFALNSLNVLIGGNGSGKSNFIDVFRLLRAMLELSLPELSKSNLATYIEVGGGFDGFLFNGPKATKSLLVKLMFGLNGYRFSLAPTASGKYIIESEETYFKKSGWWTLGSGHRKPELLEDKDKQGSMGGRSVASYIYDAIDSWRIYHFHDTSKTAAVRRYESIKDKRYLRFDASNIAPFLLHLREKNNVAYTDIVDTIRLVTPFFKDFLLDTQMQGEREEVNLSWIQNGSDYPMQPYHLSDGTLRFICLATALLQPNPPSTLIIDEPELGLHPYAVDILAELIKTASSKTQLIISTQSPALVDNFDPENIVVVRRKNGASTFERLNSEDLSQWLESYSLGDLWRKNVIAGGPLHE